MFTKSWKEGHLIKLLKRDLSNCNNYIRIFFSFQLLEKFSNEFIGENSILREKRLVSWKDDQPLTRLPSPFLRKQESSIIGKTLDWNSHGKRSKGRPRGNWRSQRILCWGVESHGIAHWRCYFNILCCHILIIWNSMSLLTHCHSVFILTSDRPILVLFSI